MDQDLVTDFNRATTIEVGCKNRIFNLIANKCFAQVKLTDTGVVVTYSTTKKGKPTQSMSYTISREHLTETQYADLVTASQPKPKA
jgi:hypothetical protein